MNVLITLAGHSRRFKQAGYDLPKAFLKLGDKLMIEHAVGMFNPDDDFHFVLSRAQIGEYPRAVEVLKSLAKKTTVTVIEPHELGPTYSLLQIPGLDPDAPVLVSYCDFFVKWDYRNFLRLVGNYDAAIPSFRGFHPASFGKTFYAYMRVENDLLVELREKQSFTPNRSEEPASAGLYYFKSWSLFKKYAEEILAQVKGTPQEAYASLLYNPMVRDGLRTFVFDVEKFICLGTPEDVEQYRFWWDYFRGGRPDEPREALPGQCNVIPMAGRGDRFRKSGYRVAKPLIQVGGSPMVVKACKTFPRAERWVFLVRAADLERHAIENALRQNFSNAAVIPVDHDTSGQAATCLLAEDRLDPDAPLFIASCDYETRYDTAAWQALVNDPGVDVAVWTYRLGSSLFKEPNAFAYCRLKPGTNQVSEVVEKRTISDAYWSDPMVVGSFWYRKAADFVSGAKTMIRDGVTVNGEHYVGTSLNALIAAGKKVVIFDIGQWISYGDPFELKVYEYWEDLFHGAAPGRERFARGATAS